MNGQGRIFRVLAMVLLLILAIGWGIDRARWQQELQPLRSDATGKQGELASLQIRLHQIETFKGFDSFEDVLSVIENSHPTRVFEDQARSIASAEAPVYEVSVPQLIEMLDHEEQEKRQRAWRLLQFAQASPRFDRYELDYRDGLVKLLHRRSIVGFNKLLPWLRDEKINDEAILAGLRSRMMDDEDTFAPYAAYVLAELNPNVDIAPRLIEMIERKHSQWRSILHRLPNYMPEDEADALFEKYQDFR
ncbi:hypothetical protein [Bremerella alba]|uniref:Uncharacterized protein n=1 Tax=Bremerella alba TaxID=980252 RepID=A0A7V8V1P9_9BACT|nr:hypothetical protein [Bremerella alba]MBA2113328.1 hypothetical protein [Bremerella alba]